jgi:hypothetical protein
VCSKAMQRSETPSLTTQDSVPIARSNVSYVFAPRRVLRRLFDDFQLSFPKQLEEHPNWTEVINEGDLLPAGLDLLSTALAGKLFTTA